MKVKPMIFNTQMVRALLDGNKTQTRRPVKHQPFFSTSVIPSWVFPRNQAEVARGDSGLLYPNAKSSVLALSGYTPGDLIYVRETFGFIRPMDFGELPDVAYKADGYWSPKKWKPSIHMPREFSRITLKVTGVRVERIQGISEADAVAEGFRPKNTQKQSKDQTEMSMRFSPSNLRSMASKTPGRKSTVTTGKTTAGAGLSTLK